MADHLDSYRDRFPILASTCYLVNHSLGAMPQEARQELTRYADAWASRGVRAWSEGWWETPVTIGDELAPIVGAPVGSIAMVQNATIAQAVIASCVSLTGTRNRVVFSELNFPSVMYLWHEVRGAHVVSVRSWDGVTVPTETFLAAIDDRTAIVPLSHVLFRSAYIQDVAAITERAHEVGALVVLDCYQSAGTLPFSLSELDVDFAVGGSVKWLCGGPGAGWLYVRPDLQETLEPRLVGWQGDRAPFDFRPGPVDYGPGIWRFLSGTPNVPALFAAGAGYRVISEVGLEAIRAKSLSLTQEIIDMADELDIRVSSERSADRRGGAVTLAVQDEDQVAAALGDRHIIVDARPGAGIRVGPHFYNSREDLAQLREGLVEILNR